MKSGGDNKLILEDRVNLLNRLSLYNDVRDAFFSLKIEKLRTANDFDYEQEVKDKKKEMYRKAAERLLDDMLGCYERVEQNEDDSDRVSRRKAKLRSKFDSLKDDLKNKL